MKQYRLKHIVDVITFEELVDYGKSNPSDLLEYNDKKHKCFFFKEHKFTIENDSEILITRPDLTTTKIFKTNLLAFLPEGYSVVWVKESFYNDHEEVVPQSFIEENPEIEKMMGITAGDTVQSALGKALQTLDGHLVQRQVALDQKKQIERESGAEVRTVEEAFMGLKIPPNPIPPYEGQKTPAHSEYDRDAELLESAMHQLKSLRQQNNHMATRLEMFDKMYALFSTGNRSGGDMCGQQPLEDRIEKRLYEKAEEGRVSN